VWAANSCLCARSASDEIEPVRLYPGRSRGSHGTKAGRLVHLDRQQHRAVRALSEAGGCGHGFRQPALDRAWRPNDYRSDRGADLLSGDRRREFASGCRDLGQLDAFPQQTLYSVGIATIAFGVTPRHARRLHRSRLQQDPARRRSARRECGIQAEVARTEERLDGLFFDIAGLGTVGIYGGLVPPWAPKSGASATGARFRSTGAKRHGDRMGALSRPGIGVVRGNDAANRTRRAAGATDRAGFFRPRLRGNLQTRRTDDPRRHIPGGQLHAGDALSDRIARRLYRNSIRLRGTASVSYTVEELLVPEAFRRHAKRRGS
jgi:hypothetical protein